jgi:hypothetical protein
MIAKPWDIDISRPTLHEEKVSCTSPNSRDDPLGKPPINVVMSVVLLTLLLALSVFHDKVMSNYGIPLVLL